MNLAYKKVLDEINTISDLIDNPTLLNEITQKAEDNKLYVMLYGAYNAGKSSLINTLLGREQAKVNDIPTTDRVDKYDWNSIVLLDTPGVNAPIAHQEIAEEEIKRASVILFVIRDGDMDSKDVYNRLIELLKEDKKIFIVLNNQLREDKERAEAEAHIRNILTKKAREFNLDIGDLAGIDIIPINIRTAFKGKVLNQCELLERSGFDLFSSRFNNWITQQGSEKERFSHFQQYVNNLWYKQKLLELSKTLSENNKNEVEHLEKEKENLQQEKIMVQRELDIIIRDQVSFNRNRLVELLGSSQDEVQLNNQVNDILSQMSRIIEDKLKTKLENISFDYKNKYSLSVIEKKENNTLIDNFTDLAKDALTNQNAIKEVLLSARSFKIPVIKGRWEKTLTGWAGKAAVIIQIGMAIYDIFKAQEEENRYNEQQRKLALELYQTVERICDDFTATAFKSVEQVISLYYEQNIKVLQSQIDEFYQHYEEINRKHSQISQSQIRMLSVQWSV